MQPAHVPDSRESVAAGRTSFCHAPLRQPIDFPGRCRLPVRFQNLAIALENQRLRRRIDREMSGTACRLIQPHPEHGLGVVLDRIPVRSGHRRVGKGALFARRAHHGRRRWARRERAMRPFTPVPGAFAHPTIQRFGSTGIGSRRRREASKSNQIEALSSPRTRGIR